MVTDRQEKLRASFADLGIDGFFTTQGDNRLYLSGFTGSAGYLIVTGSAAALVIDGRYTEQAGTQTRGTGIRVVQHTGSYEKSFVDEVKSLGITHLGFEAQHMTVAEHRRLCEALPDVTLVPVERAVESLRAIKDREEISILREAAQIADAAFAYILRVIRPGMTEASLAMELEVFMRSMGASGTSFDTIVASGWRSSLPHGAASDKVMEQGELVVLDFGAVWRGYASDMTRTVCLGTPSAKQREVYDTVLRAQVAAVAGIRAGMTGAQADALSRDVIASAGYGEYFVHSLGHGLGLAVHEDTRLAATSSDVLATDMVVTIEPGIYIPGFGGVRIEDTVLLEENGCVRFTHSTKELICL